jgi:hypothetical protein
MSDERMEGSFVPKDLTGWTTQARRDDWHMSFVVSDIRCMLAEIERLRASLSESTSLRKAQTSGEERIEAAARAAYLNAWVRGGQMRSVGEQRWGDPARADEPWRLNWIADTRVAIAEAEETARAAPEWRPIAEAPKNEMFEWGYWRDGRFSIGLAYHNVSGTWSDSCGDRSAPQYATHFRPLPAPPEVKA